MDVAVTDEPPEDSPRAILRHCIERLGGSPASTAVDHADVTLGKVTLLPHQVSGARRLRAAIAACGGALLADEVGLGKTYTALHVARRYSSVLVVAPAALRAMWCAACERSETPADVVSYERLSARGAPPTSRWRLVILDEAHHARSTTTRRYRALAALTQGAHVLLLSATPIHNRLADLQSLFALFLGAGATSLDDATLSALVVRRRVADVGGPIPVLRELVRHELAPARRVLHELRSLPPPLPPADGGMARALVALQLTRAWCSSDAALLAAIRRRLATAAALEQSLECGHLPARRDLVTWTAADDGTVQLAFPQLVANPAVTTDVPAALTVVRTHAAALRALRVLVRGPYARDHARFTALAQVLAANHGRQVVVFTHSAETAEHAFAALRDAFRVALLTGRGASLASGPVPRHDVLSAFAPDGGTPTRQRSARDNAIRRIEVLIATDVVSEGVDLQRAAIVVHLDLPWTIARVEQRMGRLRRMGSPHSAVESHLIAPPVGAEELDVTLRHLLRKAALTARTVGASSILGDADSWPGLLTRTIAVAPALARDAAIALLRRLEPIAAHMQSATRAAPASHALPCDAWPSIVRARWRVLRHGAPIVIALAMIDGVGQLLIADAAGVCLDPATVVASLEALLASLANATDPTTSPSERTSNEAAALELELAVLRWWNRRMAESELVPDATRDSIGHRRVLQALAALPSLAPRALRASVARRAADGRRLVLAQRGAASEQLLTVLAASHPPPSAGMRDALRWLDEVLTALDPPTSPFSAPSYPTSVEQPPSASVTIRPASASADAGADARCPPSGSSPIPLASTHPPPARVTLEVLLTLTPPLGPG